MYSVKEAFYTLQGEGAQAGRASVFCRFTGCNLWSGREQDRATADCTFCDTDFVGTDGINGGKFRTADDLCAHIRALWPHRFEGKARPYVVFTGGEPLLQLDNALIDAMHSAGFEIAVETNGTQLAPAGIDWICVSPKAGNQIIQVTGQELKLVFPQAGLDPAQFSHLDFTNFFIQPMDTSTLSTSIASDKNTMQAAVEYCMANPQWRLSIQTHKIAGID